MQCSHGVSVPLWPWEPFELYPAGISPSLCAWQGMVWLLRLNLQPDHPFFDLLATQDLRRSSTQAIKTKQYLMPRSDSSYTATSVGCSSTASSSLTGLCLVLHASSLSSLEGSSSSCTRSHTFSPPCAPTRESPELARSSTTSTDSEYATARLPSTDSYRSLSIPELSSAHGDVVSYATESLARSSATGASVSASSYGTAHGSSTSCHLENTHMASSQGPIPEGADIMASEANSQPR